jgi:hypothetical protein
MKLANFIIGRQNIDLEWPDGGYADLHNDFTFDTLSFEPNSVTATLGWKKSEGDWAQDVTIASLKLIFSGVSFFRVRERETGYAFLDDGCLSSVGWLPQYMRDDFDSYSPNEDAEITYDLRFVFESGWAVKLNATTVELALEMR